METLLLDMDKGQLIALIAQQEKELCQHDSTKGGPDSSLPKGQVLPTPKTPRPLSPTVRTAAQRQLTSLENQMEKYKNENKYLNFRIKELTRMLFGSKRERFISENNPHQCVFKSNFQNNKD